MESILVNLLLAFVTGLTTGGLSCLAVQGGLLASSMAHQLEKDMQHRPSRKDRKTGRPAAAPPILAFLAAKLLAYTLLGFLLGLVGQMFQLTPLTRAVLQIGIGIFMLGSALRMLNVHPIFRYFAFEPPAFIRRRLRKTAAASSSSLIAPALLGFLTVLIPCGITQAMMAAALSTADPLMGAALMFAFTLGTSPVFFSVAYFATRLGARLEKYFMRFVAVLLLFLGVVSIDSGITLAGSPYSLTRLVNAASGQPAGAEETVEEAAAPAEFAPAAFGGALQDADSTRENVITVTVQNRGYEPRTVHARAGVPLKLRLVSEDVFSCSLSFIIPSLGVELYLEPTGEAFVDIPAQEKGTRMPFSCSMGMFTGDIIFDL
jgi:sulfite exporter TauE/SafE